jgi:hypothetical protein
MTYCRLLEASPLHQDDRRRQMGFFESKFERWSKEKPAKEKPTKEKPKRSKSFRPTVRHVLQLFCFGLKIGGFSELDASIKKDGLGAKKPYGVLCKSLSK